MTKLTHLDERGAARMVDVSDKAAGEREATAEAVIVLSRDAFAAVASGGAPKGDVLAAARIAGIMAAKKTPELIPLCHSIALTKAEIAFEMLEENNAIRVLATAKTAARTGVEMEALTAASVAALTIYDMTKALDKSAVIESVRLLAKSGGKSGPYAAPPFSRARAAGNPRGGEAAGRREAFRAFMVCRRLRATEWAKAAGVPAAQIHAFLTGRLRALPPDVAGRLARAAQVRIEDMFR